MRTLLVGIIVFLCFFRAAAADEDIVPGQWEVLADQTESVREALERRGWKPAAPSLRFRLPYKVTWDYQYVWLRSSFVIEGDPGRYFGITLGNSYIINTVYINGRVVGEMTPAECRIVHNPVHYEIPPGTLVKGRNELYIRLGVYDTESTSGPGHVAIRDRESFLRTVTVTSLVYLSYPVGIIIFIATLCLFTIILFLWDRSELIFLYSAALCAILAIMLWFLHSPQVPLPYDFCLHVYYGLYPLMTMLTLIITQSMMGIQYPSVNRLAIPLLAMLSPVVWVLRFLHVAPAVPRYINTVAIFIFIPVALYIIIMTYRLKRELFKMIISAIFILFLMITGTVEMLKMMFFGSPQPEIYLLLLPLLLVGMVIFNVRKIILRKVKLIVLYQDFQRSLKPPERKTVTPATEGKISEVIRFLDENYRADISREGLAAAVDLSPDHLSRMFLASTGKKINDYVNELRVREAAQLLAGTDERIADIAVRVGFESLTTFNRNFMKMMGVTPVDYRK